MKKFQTMQFTEHQLQIANAILKFADDGKIPTLKELTDAAYPGGKAWRFPFVRHVVLQFQQHGLAIYEATPGRKRPHCIRPTLAMYQQFRPE